MNAFLDAAKRTIRLCRGAPHTHTRPRTKVCGWVKPCDEHKRKVLAATVRFYSDQTREICGDMRWRYEIAEYMHGGFVHATDDRIFANLGRKSGKRRNRWPTNRRACGTMVGRSYIRARPTIHEYHLCRHAMRVAIERRYPKVVDDILAPFPKFRSRLQIAYRLCRQSQYSDDIQIA